MAGAPGKSLNFYEPGNQQWHQVWVGGGGGVLRLDGKFENGRMTLVGHRRNPQNLDKIEWTPLPDGRVRQYWTTSQDGGVTWQETFKGFYSRM